MDFHSLTRRELQSLCKLNKIPANMTNVAMADALKSLEIVEGIEEILNPSRSETAGSSIESPQKMEVTAPRVPRTSCRTSTRQKAKKTEAESQPLTATRTNGRGVRRQLAGDVDEFLKTPAVPSTRKKAPATSSFASQLNECEEVAKKECLVDHDMKCIPNTPAAVVTCNQRTGTATSTRKATVKKETTVQRVYSTRRSARLTEKKSSEPSVERERSEPVKIDSFFDEVSVISEGDLGDSVEVPDKNAESGSSSIGTSPESDTSPENFEDYVGEESVEYCDLGVSKAKVEDICKAFEKLDVLVEGSAQKFMVDNAVNVEATLGSGEEKVKSDEISDQLESVDLDEKLKVGKDKFVLNASGNTKDANLEEKSNVAEEKFDLSEADEVKAIPEASFKEKSREVDNLKPESERIVVSFEDGDLEDKPNVTEEKINFSEIDHGKAIPEDVVLVPEEHSDTLLTDKASLLSGADDIDADAILFHTEKNPSDPARSRQEDTFCAVVSEKKNETLDWNVDTILVDVVNPPIEKEPSVDFEGPSMEETVVDLNSQNFKAEPDSADAEEEKLFLTTDAAPMKKETTHVSDFKENNVTEISRDQKPKSLHEISIRQLKKQLKALSIKHNKNANEDDKVGGTRPALQALCDNQLATGETKN